MDQGKLKVEFSSAIINSFSLVRKDNEELPYDGARVLALGCHDHLLDVIAPTGNGNMAMLP